MNASEFERAIEEALGNLAVSDGNQCGGTGYYDDGEDKPYRVLFCDGLACETFATAEETIEAARDYAEEMAADDTRAFADSDE